MRILVFRQDRVGDVVLTLPLIENLKNHFNNSFVAIYAKEVMRPIFQNNLYLDEFIPINENIYKSNYSLIKESFKLKKYKFDIALIPLPEKEIAYLTFLSGIPKRITYSRKLFNIISGAEILIKSFDPPKHESEYMLDLAMHFGTNINTKIPNINFVNNISEIDKFNNSFNIDENKKTILLNPGSGGSVPNWEFKNYFLLSEKLVDKFNVIINVPKNESKLFSYFISLQNKLDIFSGNLSELINLISNIDLVISSSTGTMHLAAALNKPTFTFFCPDKANSPTVWGAIGNDSTNIIASDKFCTDICNRNKNNCSLSEITVEQVYKHILNKFNL